MTRLWKYSDALAPGESVSTITWMGYDAPTTAIPFDQGSGLLPPATSAEYAHAAAPDLNLFTAGLREAHDVDSRSHTTLIGHSYGSTVIGAASQEGSLHADDVVVAGSPGMLVSKAGDLGVGDSHVWSLYADGDPVPNLGRPFLGGDMVDVGIGRYGIPTIDVHPPLVPSDPRFGGHQMSSDTQGHSGYWDEGSESLENQALVVVGRYGDVGLE